jgi:hypothetical protein
MLSKHITLENRPGIEELAHRGSYAVIANRELFDHDKAHRFAVVNTREAQLDNIYGNPDRARSQMQSLSQGA